MKRLDRLKTYNYYLPSSGSLFELFDGAIQSYFRLADDEFNQFFKYFSESELELLISHEKTIQSFSERRNVSQLLEVFYMHCGSYKL